MFKSEAKLFLSANNNLNYAKTLINECKRLVIELELQGNSDYTKCKSNITDCDINSLVNKVETTKESLLKLDHDFAESYMQLLQKSLTIDEISYQNISDEERFEYNLYLKDFDYTLLAILEQRDSEGNLNAEMKHQLEIQRTKIKQYEIEDEMSVLSNTSKDRKTYIDKFKEKSELDKKMIKLLYSEEEAEEKLKEYNVNFEKNIEVLNLNYNMSVKNDELKKLDQGSKEYYKKENEIRQLQINYYENKEFLTPEEEDQLAFQKDYIELNNYYIVGDDDRARTKKTQMFDPVTGECIATAAEIEYENAGYLERAWINTKTVLGTALTSVGGVFESLSDGLITLTVGTVGLFNDDVAKWTEDFVSVNWSDDAYEGMVLSGGLNAYSAYSGYHTVTDFATTTITYAGLSFIPGVGGAAVMASAAAGSTAQTAFDNGASFHEAWGASAISGALAFGADLGLDKLNSAANVSQIAKVTGRTAIGIGEPALNTIAEYTMYGHENSENIFDYAEKTGAYTNMAIGGIVANAAGAYGDYKKAKLNKYKADFNADMNAMTDAQRSKYWEDYFKSQYGADNVTKTSGIDIEGHNGVFIDPSAEQFNRNLLKQHGAELYEYFKSKNLLAGGIDINGNPIYPPSETLFKKYADVFCNPDFCDLETGAIKWPQGEGAIEYSYSMLLTKAQELDIPNTSTLSRDELLLAIGQKGGIDSLKTLGATEISFKELENKSLGRISNQSTIYKDNGEFFGNMTDSRLSRELQPYTTENGIAYEYLITGDSGDGIITLDGKSMTLGDDCQIKVMKTHAEAFYNGVGGAEQYVFYLTDNTGKILTKTVDGIEQLYKLNVGQLEEFGILERIGSFSLQ